VEKYSVLMSLYKRENPEYLSLAIDGMLKQTIKPDEIVLVEDGPLTTELYDVLDSYAEQITRIKNSKNMGLGLALNIGLRACHNEFVARMDTDDISKPNRCEIQLNKFADKPSLSIVGSHVDEFCGTPSNIVSSRRVPINNWEIYNYAKRRSAFNHPSVMYRKSKVLENGGYADLKRNQDVDLFGRMLFSGCEAENIDESLVWFRSSDELARRRKSWENSKSYINTIKNFWKMGYSSFFDYLVVLIAQTIMFFLPISFQHYIYVHILRK